MKVKNLSQYKEKALKNPEFEKEYNALDLQYKVENFQRTLKARIDMNKSITKDDIKVDEITLAQLDAENSLCNLLLVLLEFEHDENQS